MAQQTTVTLTDDIDGSKGVETISFALDGAQYEIDLNAKNAKALRKAFAEFVEAARKVRTAETVARSPRRSATPAKKDGLKEDLAAVRAWANENGIAVAARGRISEAVKEQYSASKSEAAAA